MDDEYIYIYIQNTTINSVAKGLGVITAQARETVDDQSGFAFIHCKIMGTGDTYLGRAWRKMPRVVFAYTDMGTLIDKQGWSNIASGQTQKYAIKHSLF
jgi:pectinesterase